MGIILLFPLIFVCLSWNEKCEGWVTAYAFIIPCLVSFSAGIILKNIFKASGLNAAGSMLLCSLSWMSVSLIGALPFVIGIESNFIDAYFESMSGFTTSGITIYTGLDNMPRSIIFWRALTQWLGGLGILSFFLAITFNSSEAHHVFGAESHKIASDRPAPGLFSTIKIFWIIYCSITILSILVLKLEGMTFFDSICHGFAAASTGGFSPYDSNIGYYQIIDHPNYKLIQYTIIIIMIIGSINFLVLFKVFLGNIKALWDNTEMKWLWALLSFLTIIIIIDHISQAPTGYIFNDKGAFDSDKIESIFRDTIFHVTAMLTTTGFYTKDIGSSYFPAMTKQLFLLMMIIGGCVGSTSGGFKILRTAILSKLMLREIFKTRVSQNTSQGLIVDKKLISEDEIHRISALFFTWIALLFIGGGITAAFSNLGAYESLSGMFTALGNVGPCYISEIDLINLHPVVKITYIIGMLAGRLEILPVLILFSGKAWR